MNFSPIALFTFNRPWHTRKTLSALKNNLLADKSDLIVFCDAAKTNADEPLVALVKDYVHAVTGFRSITIIEQNENKGLAKSIIEGVTSVVEEYGKVIVLEDDLITSPYFLTYMNDALKFYNREKRVMHISGWNFPMPTEKLEETFLWRFMCCWGWATWDDRWKDFRKDTDYFIRSYSQKDISQFNLDSAHDFWEQIMNNHNNKIDTWAAFWYASIFEKSGLCLNPAVSFVKNIGLDGSGQNSLLNHNLSINELNNNSINNFTINLSESKIALNLVKKFYADQKKSVWVRIKNKYKESLNKFT